MNFHVGQKVVCVNAKWNDPYWIAHTAYKPLEGGVYTIRSIGSDGRGAALFFEELKNPPVQWAFSYGEPAFYASRFRPLIERKTETGMAVLRKIASDITTKITEKV